MISANTFITRTHTVYDREICGICKGMIHRFVPQVWVASFPGPSQILSCSRGEKSGEGLGSKLRHRPEMVNSVSTN